MLLPEINCPTVIIERDIAPIIRFCKHTYKRDMLDHILMLKSRMDNIDGLRVGFGDIDDRLDEIWSHLIGTPYNKERGDMLKNLNIQVKDPHSIIAEESLVSELLAI